MLWLDGVERKYIEEVGAMNVLFKIDGKVVTPPSPARCCPASPAKGCLELLRDWGVSVEERLISAQELFDAAESGKLEGEAWGSGTAAVVSPHRGAGHGEDKVVTVNGGQIGRLTQRLYDTLTGIQWGH